MENLKDIGTSMLIQGAMYLQMVLFMRLLLPMRKLDAFKHIVLWIGVCIGLSVFVLAGYDNITYFIIITCILTLCLFKGKSTHKLLGITMSIAFNFIIESMLVYMIRGKLDQIIMDEDVLEIVMRLENLVAVLMIIAILKIIGIDKRQSNRKQLLPRKEAIMLTAITVFSTLSVYAGMNIINGEIQVVGNVYFFIGLIVIGIVLNLEIIILIDRNVHMRYYKTLSEMSDRQLNEQIKYYEEIKKNQMEIRSIKHDMKNHFLCIQMLAQEGETVKIGDYINQLTSSLEKAAMEIYTGNAIVDALLNNKIKQAEEKGVKVDTSLGRIENIGIEPVDLCIILSNALDNALEAVDKVYPNIRKISIEMKVIKGYFILKIVNSINVPVMIKNKNTIKTTKENNTLHGYGLKNINGVVEKYKGILELMSDNEFFRLEIIIELGVM